MGLFQADGYYEDVEAIPLGELDRRGIRLIILDRDNTCVPWGSDGVSPGVLSWVGRARLRGMLVCLVSNNIFGTSVEASARELGAEICIHHAFKPAPFALWHALSLAGAAPGETVLIGDQVFTDVLAGNLAGLHTILVRPQTRHDLWYTRVLRRLERRVLRGHVFLGKDGHPAPPDS